MSSSVLAAEKSCRATVGSKQADLWVRQCIVVSPATHPPCNAVNPCELIVNEIRRSCIHLAGGEETVPADIQVLNDSRTAFCKEYLKIEK